MAVPYHTHTFEIPAATPEEAAEGVISDKVVVPSSLPGVIGLAVDAAVSATTLYETRADAEANSISADIHSITTKGLAAAGDGLAGLYIDTDTGSDETFMTEDGRTWYRANDVGVQRLTPAVGKNATKEAYFRRIQKVVPLSGGSYASIIATFGHAFLIPQGFWIDQTNKRIYVLYNSDSPDTTIYVFVWTYTDWNDPDDITYVSSFRVATTTGDFAESIVVREESGTRYAYMRAGGDILKKYDITTLPADMGLVAPAATVLATGVYSQFYVRNGEWIVQQPVPATGQQTRRGHFAKYDNTLTTRKGSVQFNAEDVGPWTQSAYEQYFPKVQGIAMGEGYYALQLGGRYISGTPTPYTYQGLKLAKSDGTIYLEAALDPLLAMSILGSAGLATPTTLEGEGICIPEDSQIYTLSWYLSVTGAGAPANVTEGIVIMKEFSKDTDALDFSSAGVTFPSFDRPKFSIGHFPRSTGGLVNPVTGATFTTIEQICDFMVALDVPRFEFYTSTISGILDPSGTALPSGTYVTILNANNVTFPIIYQHATSNSGVIRGGIIAGTAGSRTLTLQPWTRGGVETIPDADSTLTVGSSKQFQTFAPLTAGRTITISKTGATEGSEFELRRFGGAFNATILNGAGGSTIDTMAANAYSKFVYSGSNWFKFN